MYINSSFKKGRFKLKTYTMYPHKNLYTNIHSIIIHNNLVSINW